MPRSTTLSEEKLSVRPWIEPKAREVNQFGYSGSYTKLSEEIA
jgi:hypothetical protein